MEIKRNLYLDNIAGFFIMYMMIMHSCLFVKDDSYQIVGRFVYFFMPWFFYKGGAFFKEKGSEKEFVLTSFRRLIIPYIIVSLIGFLISLGICLHKGTSILDYLLSSIKTLVKTGTICGEVSHLWFLIGLFVSRLLLYYFNKYNFVFWGIICSIILIIFIFHLELTQIWYIFYSLTGFLYYGLGYMLREKQYTNSLFVISSLIYILSVIMTTYYDQHNSILYSGVFEVALIYPIFACVFANNISKYFMNKKTIFCFISKYAMLLYVTHYPIMSLISRTGILNNVDIVWGVVLLNTSSFFVASLLVVIFKDRLRTIGL